MLLALPPEPIGRILAMLPLPDLARFARTCRRAKVLAYSDDVFVSKLVLLGLASYDEYKDEDNKDDASVLWLKQMPGGQFLSAAYIDSGSLFSGNASDATPPGPSTELSTGNATDSTPGFIAGSTGNVSETTPVANSHIQNSQVSTGNTSDTTNTTPTNTTTTTTTKTTASQKKISKENTSISSVLPDMRTSSLIIGAGGIKAALAKQLHAKTGAPPSKSKRAIARHPFHSSLSKASHKHSTSARLEFMRVYTQLSPYYFDFATHSNDAKLFKDFTSLPQLGLFLNRLNLLDRAHLVDDCQDASIGLETAIQWFESFVVGQFEDAYDHNDIPQMQNTATALYHLNGGRKCVEAFIAKNPISFDNAYNPSLISSKLPAATGPALGFTLADEFAKFLEHTLVNCISQCKLIAQVFVKDTNAMTIFINKVFEDCISEYLTAILAAAKSRENQLVYLHTLATSVYSCTQFIDLTAKNPYGVPVDVDTVRMAMQDIVKPYAEKYIALELDYLNKRFKAELEKWDKRGQKKHKGKDAAGGDMSTEAHEYKRATRLSAMKAIISAPATLAIAMANVATGGGIISKPKSKLHRESLLSDAEPISSADASDHDDTVTYHLHGSGLNSLVSLELALHLMHANKESLGRALVVTASTDMSRLRTNVQKIFVSLLKAVGDKHIKPAFGKALEVMSKSGPVDSTDAAGLVNMDSLQFFELVHITDMIQQMIDVYYNDDVKIWIDETDFLSEIIVEKKAFERLLDDGVAAGMDKAIQILVNQCEYILIAQQGLQDYNPSDTGLFDWRPTRACSSVVECLEIHTKLMSSVTEKNTMEVFLGEVAVRLFSVIIKNIRRLQVSQTGAMQLICDMNKYYAWATSVRITSTAKLFSILKEIGNLFLADGSEELRKLVHDAPRFQSALRIEEIYELLQSRTDYRKIQKQVESKDCVIQ